jgi:hypothetical protein
MVIITTKYFVWKYIIVEDCMAISDVSVKNGLKQVFNESGKKVSEMTASRKEVRGIASDFFVVLDGTWIQTYDEKCKKIKEMPTVNKIVRGAAGTTFTVKTGPWIQTYDRNCKKVSERTGS